MFLPSNNLIIMCNEDISCLCFFEIHWELKCVDSSLFYQTWTISIFISLNILTVSFFPLFLEKKEMPMLLCDDVPSLLDSCSYSLFFFSFYFLDLLIWINHNQGLIILLSKVWYWCLWWVFISVMHFRSSECLFVSFYNLYLLICSLLFMDCFPKIFPKNCFFCSFFLHSFLQHLENI